MANNNTPRNNWVDEKLAALRYGGEWQPDVQKALGRFLTKRAAAKNWVWRRWAIAGAMTAGACLFAMFLPSPRVLAHRCLACSVAVWQTLSGAVIAQSDLKPASERQTAPDFELTDANGKEVKLSELKGKVVLVNFWATWCEGCQVEIPWFVEFAKKYEGQGLVVIGVSMDGDGWKAVRPWIKEKNVNYTIVIGNEALGRRYGLEGMPLTALVGRDGKVADTHAGIVDRDATEKNIGGLLREEGK
jgi:peroxiredoxin